MTDDKESLEWPFEELEVWQMSMDLSERIQDITRAFPDHETYGLVDQERRSSISVTMNIAEGKGRYSKKEFLQYLYRARGSLYETVTGMKLSVRKGYITKEQQVDINKLAM